MATIKIHSEHDDIQAIIDASHPGDKLIFQDGIYALKEPLYLKSHRYYIARYNLFVNDGVSDEFMIKVVADDQPLSLFHKAIDWVRGILRLPRTLTRGFVLYGAGMHFIDMYRCKIDRCMVTHGGNAALRF